MSSSIQRAWFHTVLIHIAYYIAHYITPIGLRYPFIMHISANSFHIPPACLIGSGMYKKRMQRTALPPPPLPPPATTTTTTSSFEPPLLGLPTCPAISWHSTWCNTFCWRLGFKICKLSHWGNKSLESLTGRHEVKAETKVFKMGLWKGRNRSPSKPERFGREHLDLTQNQQQGPQLTFLHCSGTTNQLK